VTSIPIEHARRHFAEELRHLANIRDDRVIEAFATVPRERFVGDGPWHFYDQFEAQYWQAADTDPRRVYHNVLIALDPTKRLNTGEPSLWARHFDALRIGAGERVLQIGTGTGYFSAILAELVGRGGQVRAIELDPELAEKSRRNLAAWPQVELVEGNGLDADGGPFDLIIAFAGVPAPVPGWHRMLAPAGRALYPLTGEQGGFALRIDRQGELFAARAVWRIWIYPCIGSRAKDDIAQLQAAFDKLDFRFIRSLRLDPHEADGACWLHGDGWCLSCRAPG